MNVLAALLTLVLLAAVIALIGAPLLKVRRPRDPRLATLAELELAREAKYREIRDLELDYRTGKLSPGDYEATGGALRAEALELLNRLEALERAAAEAETDEEARPRAS